MVIASGMPPSLALTRRRFSNPTFVVPPPSPSRSSLTAPPPSEPHPEVPDLTSSDVLLQFVNTPTIKASPPPSMRTMQPPAQPAVSHVSNVGSSGRKPPPLPISVPTHQQPFSIRRVHSDSELLCLSRAPTTPRRQFVSLTRRARPEEYDGPTATRFASRVVSAVNDSAICVLMSIGHQLGLFSVLSRLSDRPHSAGTIAQSARELHPRYVQEWLSAMACVGIIEEFVVPSAVPGREVRKYRLPPEHAALLTWDSRVGNMALLSQYIPILGRLEDLVAGCFRTGNGLGAAAFAHFDSVASLDTLQTIGDGIEAKLLSKVPGLVQDLEDGVCVLCVGGNGDAVYIQLAKRFPRSWFTCYDPSVQQMKAAQKMIAEAGAVSNIHFRSLPEGLEAIQEQGSYDVGLVLDGWFVRNAPRPTEALRMLSGALKKGCALLYVETVARGGGRQDRGLAAAPLLYTLSTMHCVPRAMDGRKEANPVGGMWGHEEAKKAMEEGGFEGVRVLLEKDEVNCVLLGQAPQGRMVDSV